MCVCVYIYKRYELPVDEINKFTFGNRGFITNIAGRRFAPQSEDGVGRERGVGVGDGKGNIVNPMKSN